VNQCRHCENDSLHTLVDLGFAPPSNAYLSKAQLCEAEIYLPLHVLVCDQCWLVQTQDFVTPDTFFSDDYAYFSSTSSSWLAHAKAFCEQMKARFGLTSDSLVIEIAANDGYLLKNFVAEGIPCLGIEPTASTASVAREQGIEIIGEFFTEALANQLVQQSRLADLVVANNVFAHVPDINGFSAAMAAVLKPEGVISLEFPHLLQLLQQVQFDTIYHEHFSYLSLYSVNLILSAVGLRIFDVEQLPTHGGSLRVFVCHQGASFPESERVQTLLELEAQADMQTLKGYQGFQSKVEAIKHELLLFLLTQRRLGKTVVAYGAAAKGNTLLNFAGVKPDLLSQVYDAAPSKQGKFLPGSHIPILAPCDMPSKAPDYMLILPWNIANEVICALDELKQQGCQFVTAIPKITLI